MSASIAAPFALAGSGLLALLLSPPIVGDCMMPPPIAEAVQAADIVFVGTVAQTTNRNTWASVDVTEVWRGPDLPTAVIVRGGPGGNAASSIDRAFEPGVTYLFFPYADPELGLADNSCTSTTPWSEELAELRPADARQPTGGGTAEGGFDPAGLLVPIGVALLVGGALIAAGLIARGRTSD